MQGNVNREVSCKFLQRKTHKQTTVEISKQKGKNMIRKTLITIVGTVAMAAMIQTAQASLDLGTTATLAALDVAGTYLTIGDKTFSDFSYNPSGLTSFNAANITVTATEVGGNYYLTWGGNISVVSSAPVTADLLLGYTVSASAGNIVAIDQNYTGSAQNNSDGSASGTFISVRENVYAPGNITPLATSYLNENIPSTPFTLAGAILAVGEPTVNVTKDIGLGISDPTGGFITISQIVQSFDQTVPEPTTMIAGALLLLPFGASTLRILRKNRTA